MTWSKSLGEFVLADVARSKAIALDPKNNDSNWDKAVIGVNAIEDYFRLVSFHVLILQVL